MLQSKSLQKVQKTSFYRFDGLRQPQKKLQNIENKKIASF